MLTPIDPPAEEFRQLTELEVEAALRLAADPNHPIVSEVTRLMQAYGDTMVELVALYGRVPDDFHLAPRWPIELVAARLFKQEMNEHTQRKAN